MQVNGISGINRTYLELSTLRKINSAADNASGLAISQKLISQRNGYDTGTDNGGTSQDMVKTAEGGLGQIQDSLQRIRELSLQASNGIYTTDDKQNIQDEIESLKSSIKDAAKGTEFNTMRLLDGSMADTNLALNPSGNGMMIQFTNSTLENLGISDYDVTGNFDVSAIDKAIQKVSDSRSSLGSKQNVLDRVMNYNTLTSLNLNEANSKIVDSDVGKSVSDKQKEEILNEYRLFTLKENNRTDTYTMNNLLKFY